MAPHGDTPGSKCKGEAAVTPNAGTRRDDATAADMMDSLILPSSVKGKATHLSPLRSTTPPAKTANPPRLLVSSFSNDEDDEGDYRSVATEDESTSLHTATQRLYIGGSHMDDSSVGTFSTYDRSTVGNSTIYEDAVSCVSSVDFPTLKIPPTTAAPPAAAAATTANTATTTEANTAAPPSTSTTRLSEETSTESSDSKKDEPVAPKLVISIGNKSPKMLALKETNVTADKTPKTQNMSSTFSATSLTTTTTNTTDFTQTQAHLSSVPEKTIVTQPSLTSVTGSTSTPARLHMPQSQSSVASSSIDNQTSTHDFDTLTTNSSVAPPSTGPRTNTDNASATPKTQQAPQNEAQYNKKRSKSLLSILKAKNKIKKTLLGSSSSKKQSSSMASPSKRKQSGKASRLSSDGSVVSRASLSTPNKKKRTATSSVTDTDNDSKKQSTQRPSSSASIVSSASTTSAPISKKKTFRQHRLIQNKYNSTSNLATAKTPADLPSSPKSIDSSSPVIKPSSTPNLVIAATNSSDTDGGTSKKSSSKKSDQNSDAQPSPLFDPTFSSIQPAATTSDAVHESERRRKDQSNVERDTLQALWKLSIDDDDTNNAAKEEQQDPLGTNPTPRKKKINSTKSSASSSRPVPTDLPLSIQVSSSKESKELDDDDGDVNFALPSHLQSQRQQEQEQKQKQYDNIKYPQGQFSHASRAEIDEGDDKSTKSLNSSVSPPPSPASSVQELTNQLLKERTDFKRKTKLNATKHQQQIEEVMQSVNVVEKEYMSMIDDLHVLLQQKEENLNTLTKQLNESKMIQASLEEKENESKRKLAEVRLELDRTRISSRDAQAKADRVVERLEKQCKEKDVAMEKAVRSLKDEVARQFKEGDEMYEVLMEQYKIIEAERNELKNKLGETGKDKINLSREQTKSVMRMRAEFAMLQVPTTQPNDSSEKEDELSIEVERDIVKKKNAELTKFCEELLGIVEASQKQTRSDVAPANLAD